MGSSSSKTKAPAEVPTASTAPSSNRDKARAKVTSKDKAVLELKNARDRLRRYQARLDVEAQQLHASAKELLQAEKRVCCICC
jgi:hypothetical protein